MGFAPKLFGLNADDKRVYRNSSQRTVGIVALLFFDAIAVDFVFQYPGRAWVLVFAVLYACLMTLIFSRLAFSRIVANDQGIEVKNVLSGFALRWDEIDRFIIGRWKLLPYVCLICLHDDRVLHAIGIEEKTNFANGSAEEIVRQLNRALASRRQRSSGDDEQIRTGPGSAQSELFGRSKSP
ncbi:MAG TPA: hypothetical protein VNS60_00100 [Solirubrobacterales bacterium]|nr:hypothetical protein [Solirubrobacterales bacterium]